MFAFLVSVTDCFRSFILYLHFVVVAFLCYFPHSLRSSVVVGAAFFTDARPEVYFPMVIRELYHAAQYGGYDVAVVLLTSGSARHTECGAQALRYCRRMIRTSRCPIASNLSFYLRPDMF